MRPYQPDGVWEEMFMGRFRYEPSEGAAQYRRTLYAFWRRAIAPTFLFDSAQRRVCEVRTVAHEHAAAGADAAQRRQLPRGRPRAGRRALHSRGRPANRLRDHCRRSPVAPADDRETAVLQRELDRALRLLPRRIPPTRSSFSPSGRPIAVDGAQPAAELAAHMLVASLILNLDEAITHE